ncbi:MAG: ABA4-like family protein [Flavobacteriaceae bacterium]
MTTATVFTVANFMAMPMWLLMILFPKWKLTKRLIDFKVIPLLLSALYALYIYLSVQEGGGLDFGSLASVMELFTNENAVLAGWVHYLAFDLLVGMWMLNQNKNLGIHQLLMAVCLFGTFMLGPVGFLAFTMIRTFKKEKS